MPHTHPLHEKALTLAKQYLRTEAQLLEVLQEIDRTKLFRDLGYTSLHTYTVEALGLSDSQAYGFISVARKSVVVPELKAAITSGELNVNTARKIVPVLTPQNQQEWLTKAKEMKQKDLEREVAALNPEQAIREKIKPVCEKRLELKCGITPKLEALLRRVQDLETQRTKSACSLEQAIQAMAETYLEKKDPVKKAERVTARSKPTQSPPAARPKSRYIPAPILHQVRLRDRGQCQHPGCRQTRWVEVHHRKPFSLGGGHSLDNLITLCSAHHKWRHDARDKAFEAVFRE